MLWSVQRLRLLVALVATGGVVGCAHAPVSTSVTDPRTGAAREAPMRATGGQVTGVWDWVFRSKDHQGNLRVEQEEWHLVQQGNAIEGYYDRALTLLSIDDHLFRCNQQLGFTTFTRVRVSGSVDGQRVRMQEVGFDARPGPCDDGARSLNRYTGEVAAATLRLEWAGRLGEQTLLKRQRAGGPRLAQMVGLDPRPQPQPLPAPGSGPRPGPEDDRGPASALLHPGVPIHGVFTWELKTVDAEGDVRNEHEEWHLDEEGPTEAATRDGQGAAAQSAPTSAALKGYYVRTVKRAREGSVFPCNGMSAQETRVRFDLSGHRTADTLVLVETSHRADPDRCDNGLRRLDTYRGSISDTGDEVVLSWGSGNQVLRRVVPAASVKTDP